MTALDSIAEAPEAPSLPPLLRGRPAGDPFAAACAEAARGCDPGAVFYDAADGLAAALVLAPEVPLEEAVAMWPACGVGLQNALGALGPSEMAVQLEWDGGVLLNGARCGRTRAAAPTREPSAVPSWLVVGVEVPWRLGAEPGLVPDRTALSEEGCADLAPLRLLESWSRHTLVWIQRWLDEGAGPLHAEWRGLVPAIGREVSVAGEGGPLRGTVLGADERFGLILRGAGGTRVVPLSTRLEVR